MRIGRLIQTCHRKLLLHFFESFHLNLNRPNGFEVLIKFLLIRIPKVFLHALCILKNQISNVPMSLKATPSEESVINVPWISHARGNVFSAVPRYIIKLN